ncbi:hypothetical protein BS78_02G252200 [Paspalum vaginatum]|nr:hypothetical protein BS78_02G252200 [Paspalum vaginatum]
MATSAPNSKQLRPDAEPYTPPRHWVHVEHHLMPPTPQFFAAPPTEFFAPPPPPPGFVSGLQGGCWGVQPGLGCPAVQGAFLRTPLEPPPPMHLQMPYDAFPAQAMVPWDAAGAVPHGGGKEPPRTVRTRPAPLRASGQAGTGSPRGAKASGAAKEQANVPSPRSVLHHTSPPISPTTSLPSSFPLPYPTTSHTPPAAAGIPSATEIEAPAGGALPSRRAPVDPPRRRRRPRRARRAPPSAGRHARRGVARLLFDLTSERTSLMIRNIPNDFTRMRLMNIIDQHCFLENLNIAQDGVRSEYDFVYVPIDFRTFANKGYAFVNMTSPEAARRLWEHLHGHRWEVAGSGKTCAVDYAAVEGLEQLVQHFSGSSFACHTVEFLPVRFDPPRDGTRPAVCTLHVVGSLARS